MVLVSVSSEEKFNKRYVRGAVFSSRFFQSILMVLKLSKVLLINVMVRLSTQNILK